MKISIYPKDLLESAWKKDKRLLTCDADNPPCCLRCGQPLERQLTANSPSRYLNVYVCHSCGADEAVRNYQKNPLPLSEWHAITSGRLLYRKQNKHPLLIPSCSFSEIFKNTAKDLEKPSSSSANETVYSRSDYDGYKWWTTWNDCNKEKPAPALIQEINQFHNALFSMKEFQSLDTMRRICRFAECTNDSTEYNLYSETEHFYIWIRMITRFRDYNLYVHYYLK